MIHVLVNHGALILVRVGYQKYRYIGIPNSNYINQLFPFNCRRRLTRDIVKNPVNVINLIYDANRNLLQDVPWNLGKVSRHPIDTGYQGRGRSSLLCFCVAVTGLLKTFKAGGKIDGAVFPINA